VVEPDRGAAALKYRGNRLRIDLLRAGCEIQKVELVGQTKFLRNLPDDAEVRRHIDSLSVCIAGSIKDTLPHVVEALKYSL